RPRETARARARRSSNGDRRWPAKISLWFFRPQGDCPAQWYNQPFVAIFKSQSFYQPKAETCENVYNKF
ncbi:cell wall hydrolase, partial [Bacillus subtilis]|nr:cell wall hydrolase [Bacillus subtilis]